MRKPTFKKICREKSKNACESSFDHITVTSSLTSKSEMEVFEDSEGL